MAAPPVMALPGLVPGIVRATSRQHILLANSNTLQTQSTAGDGLHKAGHDDLDGLASTPPGISGIMALVWYQWDHGVSFETASLAFDDPLAVSRPDHIPMGNAGKPLG